MATDPIVSRRRRAKPTAATISPKPPKLTNDQLSRALQVQVRKLLKEQRRQWCSRRQAAITALLCVNRAIVLLDVKVLRELLKELDATI
jgi:hypothetical protein